MFGYLEGELIELTPSHTYLDVNGVGYDVQLTLHTYDAIQGKKKCRLYIHFQVREDAFILYGFATVREREAFQRLLSVSGVGSATARVLLSSISADELNRIVWNGDSGALQKVKGIGAKTAQRIILELKGKLPDVSQEEINTKSNNTNETDALNALLGLGIAKNTASAAIEKIRKQHAIQEMSTENLIKTALKNL